MGKFSKLAVTNSFTICITIYTADEDTEDSVEDIWEALIFNLNFWMNLVAIVDKLW